MILPIDPTAVLTSGIAPSNLMVGSEEALSHLNQAVLHQGNGEKFVFDLPKDLPSVESKDAASNVASVTAIGSQSTSFGHLAQEMVREVNSYQQVAGDKVRDVLMGGKTSIQEAMVSVQESTVAFQLLSQVRNKLIDSYQELNRMQI